jgi:hypothetical protein
LEDTDEAYCDVTKELEVEVVVTEEAGGPDEESEGEIADSELLGWDGGEGDADLGGGSVGGESEGGEGGGGSGGERGLVTREMASSVHVTQRLQRLLRQTLS